MSEPNPLHVDAPLALCLSGGGLRATLFHLGVIQSLRAARRGERSALESVGEIYSVSGGSILAAHLVLNWEKYCGTEDEFQLMATQIRALAHRDIRNRVVRRWVGSNLLIVPRLMGRSCRTYWLTKEYESLYGKACLDDLGSRDALRRPTLHILSTSFRTGDMCSFSAGRFEISQGPGGGQESESISTPAGLIRVAFAVAASSAFPPLFPPVRLTDRMLGNTDIPDLLGVTDLSDGGVYDNLGAEKLIHDRSTGCSAARTVVLSNAGASFRTEHKTSLWGVVSRNVRASDIMMRRAADNTDHRIALAGMEVVDVRIGKTADAAYLSEHTQIKLKKIRTDLDRFPPMLADMLIAHGFGSGLRALRKYQFETGDAHPETPKASAERLDREAENAAKRSALALDLRDWTTYALVLFLAAVLAVLGWSINAYVAKRIAESEKALLVEEERKRKEEEQLEAHRKAVEDAANGWASSNKYRTEVELLKAKVAGLTRDLEARGQRVAPVGFSNADYRVWVQFAGTLQRSEMIDFGKRIKQQWPNAPGAERGGERTGVAAGLREVRYGSPEELPAALRLTADIEATGLVTSMNPPKQVRGIPSRSLEIWVSR